jgi:hypothetical protein
MFLLPHSHPIVTHSHPSPVISAHPSYVPVVEQGLFNESEEIESNQINPSGNLSPGDEHTGLASVDAASGGTGHPFPTL